jgi:carbonic anhydrase
MTRFSFSIITILTGILFSTPTKAQDLWSYDPANGPEKWGALSNEFAACNTGSYQSPINIEGTDPAILHGLQLHYNVNEVDLRHTGKQIIQNYKAGSFLHVGDKHFELRSFTFRTPAEHTIAEKSYPLEVQFEHIGMDGTKAILSVLGSEGLENKALKEIITNLPLEPGQNSTLNTAFINARDLVPHNKSYYRYNGSLTYPPCTEGVNWYILKTPIEFSKEQIDLLNALSGNNARPLHSRNHRIILDTNQ